MSGHSKWSSIKHKKGKEDAKRGKIFTKLIKEITTATRISGKDIENNPRLRTAIQKAKSFSMPADNITKAIKKGTGEIEGIRYDDFTYEGYGPSGVAILVEVTTDNKNRTIADIRHLFSKYGGNLGESGCVNWMFEKKGYISIDKTKYSEDEIMTIALETGASDIKEDEENFEIIIDLNIFEKVKQSFQEKNIEFITAEITMVPKSTIKLEGRKAQQMLNLMELLEDLDDVQNVYANFDISLEEMEKINTQE
ncbi:MAG: YebC/PmpR family DNA-binding transcriptional regulator [bacterium]